MLRTPTISPSPSRMEGSLKQQTLAKLGNKLSYTGAKPRVPAAPSLTLAGPSSKLVVPSPQLAASSSRQAVPSSKQTKLLSQLTAISSQLAGLSSQQVAPSSQQAELLSQLAGLSSQLSDLSSQLAAPSSPLDDPSQLAAPSSPLDEPPQLAAPSSPLDDPSQLAAPSSPPSSSSPVADPSSPKLAESSSSSSLESTSDEEDEGGLSTSTQQPSQMMKCRFIKAKRMGAKPWILTDDDFTYKPVGVGRDKKIRYYDCTERFAACCQARIVYNTAMEGFIWKTKGVHTHPPDVQYLRAMLEERSVLDDYVNSMSTQQVKPQQVLDKILQNLEKAGCPESKAFVSSKSVIRGKWRRGKVKAKLVTPLKVPKTFADLAKTGISGKFAELESKSQFLR